MTTGYATSSAASLPVRNVQPVEMNPQESQDLVLAGGLEIGASLTQAAVDSMAEQGQAEASADSVDEALTSLLDEVPPNEQLE